MMLPKNCLTSDDDYNEVRSIDNHIYFYCEVNRKNIQDLMCKLREVDSKLCSETATREATERVPIWLHIQSQGGDIFSAIAAADQIPRLSSPVFSVAEGLCASAATIISIVCVQRYITPNSFLLVHQGSHEFWGRQDEMEEYLSASTLLMSKLKELYRSRTKLSEEEVEELLRRDSWIDSSRALALGFVDNVY